MIERIDTEVAIIGGGIVGGSAALFLRRLGVPVVLLEAAPVSYTHLRAHET